MKRRILAFVVTALGLLGIGVWLRVADGRPLPGGWRPPKVSIGRETRARTPTEPTSAVEWGVVTCTADVSLGADPGRLVARAEDGRTFTSTANDRTLSLELEPGDWTLSWHSGTGVRPAELRRLGLVEVDASEVQHCTLPPRGWTLQGEVRDLRGEPLVGELVEGCGATAHTDESGRFSIVLTRGDCLVRAWAVDGLLHRPSDPLYFSPFDVPASPTFRVDGSAIGGVGLGLVSTGRGLRVSLAVEGGSGGAAGIAVDDVIVAVNGESVTGWTVEHGVEEITGAPGTRVTLRVSRGGAEHTYELVRGRIEEETKADTGNSLP